MISDSLLNQIQQGREGRSQGFSMGLPKLEGIIDGVSQGIYTLIFSPSGVGKTSLALFSYIYKPLIEHLDDDRFKIIYYSLEISAEMLLAKLLSLHIYETYGKELSTKEILSRKRHYRLSDDDYKIVEESMKWLQKVEDHMVIYDKGLNSSILYSSLIKELEQDGTFSEDGKKKIYTPNDPDKITLVVIDHMSLARPSEGRTLKQEIDLMSSYLVTLRNRCKISPLVIMQANRESSSMDRRKESLNNLTINDVKDTGGPVQDSEIVLSIFSPFREKLSSYRGYDIKQLESNIRIITVLKNRYGEADVEIGCGFYGKTGMFGELPRPDEIYDYDKYTTPDWIINKQDIVKKEDTSNNKSLNFTL